MEIIVILFLLVFCSVLIYLVKNSLNKIEFYEKFINDRRQRYERLLNTIREIDSKELFEKDDDVGAVFTQIKEEIESFENILD